MFNNFLQFQKKFQTKENVKKNERNLEAEMRKSAEIEELARNLNSEKTEMKVWNSKFLNI